MNMSEQLTEGERTILRSLSKLSGRVATSVLADITRQKEERVISILNSLAEKGIVRIETQEIITYSLTREGKEYAVHGLPEIRLLRNILARGGSANLDEVMAKAGIPVESKGIAMNWAKRNGWVTISKEMGETTLTTTLREVSSPVQEAIEQLAADSPSKDLIDETTLKQLIERKLVNDEITKRFEAEISKEYASRIPEFLADTGEDIGDLTPEILAIGSWRGKTFRSYNVGIVPEYVNYGKKHPYAEFIDWLREIMIGLGFTEWFGPYVETEFWGHDALFVPQDHVARDVQDQFRIAEPYDHGHIIDKQYYESVKRVHENGGTTGSKGWDWPYSQEIATRLCLRPHTTPVSMRYLHGHRVSPQKMFIIDRNFRSETVSATHAQEFDQCEGIIMDKGLTLRDLLGYLTSICKAVGIEKLKFKPGQFPFTEPSVETFGKHETLGWMELGGSGIFRPEVTSPLGIKDPVLAWGLGPGRLYMASMGINDIRELLSQDLNWLRRSYFVK
jgi:phenylalanyl-tRNA synthetase alpha chain